MNRAYLLVFFLLAASFTGCIEEELEEDSEGTDELAVPASIEGA